MMSTNYHKTVMCHVCGRVMRDDNLKRHIGTKHESAVSNGQRGEAQQLQSEELLEVSKANCTDVKANI